MSGEGDKGSLSAMSGDADDKRDGGQREEDD